MAGPLRTGTSDLDQATDVNSSPRSTVFLATAHPAVGLARAELAALARQEPPASAEPLAPRQVAAASMS